MDNKPIGLYLHFPWCVKKCPYCDFNSHEFSGELPQATYIEALINDLDRDMRLFEIDSNTTVSSIFMGGGTPSLFSPSSISELLHQIRARLILPTDTEITLEANPGTTDYEKFAGYYEAGVNRISLGVQSFGTTQLNALGRIHTSNEATQAFYAAREAGFTNINLDLMHGLPQQGLDGAISDLKIARDLGPEHISWYQLTIEPNTVFYSQTPRLPSDGVLWDIFTQGTEFLAANGYQRYEISAFHSESNRSTHNMNYWQFGDYLGIGAGAHGKISREHASELTIMRTNKTRKPSDYLGIQKLKQTTVETDELLLEFLMNALRLTQGFSLQQFQTTTGLPLSALNKFLEEATKKKLVETRAEHVKPTELGLQYLNDLLLLAT